MTRNEKGCIKLSKATVREISPLGTHPLGDAPMGPPPLGDTSLCSQVREINKYTLQDDSGQQQDVPRVGMYILQDERCWELLPPEEELEMWITKLQLAVFGQDVIAHEYVTAEKSAAAASKVRDLKGAHSLTLHLPHSPRPSLTFHGLPRPSTAFSQVRDLKGAHYLTLQQQYGLMLATYKDRAEGSAGSSSSKGGGGGGGEVPPAEGEGSGSPAVYIMSLDMDGAGACLPPNLPRPPAISHNLLQSPLITHGRRRRVLGLPNLP